MNPFPGLGKHGSWNCEHQAKAGSCGRSAGSLFCPALVPLTASKSISPEHLGLSGNVLLMGNRKAFQGGNYFVLTSGLNFEVCLRLTALSLIISS